MRLAITGIAIMVLVAISSAVATWDVGTRIRTILGMVFLMIVRSPGEIDRNARNGSNADRDR